MEFLSFLESLRAPWLDAVMRVVTLLGSEALGERIADYIVTFDAALKLYFSQTEPEDRQMRSAVERLYLDYLGRQNIAV